MKFELWWNEEEYAVVSANSPKWLTENQILIAAFEAEGVTEAFKIKDKLISDHRSKYEPTN